MSPIEPTGTITRLHGAEAFVVPSRSGGDPHLITVHNDSASCTCPATGTCWAIRRVMGRDGFAQLAGVAAEREALAGREAELVGMLRTAGVSWHRIAVALGRTSEGVRKRYRSTTP